MAKWLQERFEEHPALELGEGDAGMKTKPHQRILIDNLER